MAKDDYDVIVLNDHPKMVHRSTQKQHGNAIQYDSTKIVHRSTYCRR